MATDPFPYADATALVTGGTSGIGQAIAHELAARGIRRLVVVARDTDETEREAAALRAKGTDAIGLAFDLTEPDAVRRLVTALNERSVAIDLLVNNAGVGSAGPFAGPDDDTRGSPPADIVALNVAAVVALTEALLPPMRERGFGAILNLGSTAGHQPVPFSAVYAASKAFVLSFSQALWAENLDTGVRVTAVVPGVTRTDFGGPGQGEVRGGLERVKVSEPEEVARTALDALDASDATRIVGTRNAFLDLALGSLPEPTAARIIAAFKTAA